MKCEEILQKAKSRLHECNIPSADSDAEFLLAYVLGIGRGDLRMDMDISADVCTTFTDLIARREMNEPMDSIFGFTEFRGLKIPFSVDTLTPRQETEIMTDSIIKDNMGRGYIRILDMCAGSGCIGLSLKRHLDCDVTLADISKKALTQCKINAEINNISVDIVESDLFSNIKGTFDIIVSNPPYIPSQDILTLEKEVAMYDPHISLDGGEDGLEFYRKILSVAPRFLNKKGVIYLEFGINQSEKIYKLMERDFEDIAIVKDYSGLDRYIKGKKKC